MPELHVIAAGSLSEFAIEEPSFSMPVGRIEYLHLGPMQLEEFLLASGKDKLVKFLNEYSLGDSICYFPSSRIVNPNCTIGFEKRKILRLKLTTLLPKVPLWSRSKSRQAKAEPLNRFTCSCVKNTAHLAFGSIVRRLPYSRHRQLCPADPIYLFACFRFRSTWWVRYAGSFAKYS